MKPFCVKLFENRIAEKDRESRAEAILREQIYHEKLEVSQLLVLTVLNGTLLYNILRIMANPSVYLYVTSVLGAKI